MQLIQQLLNKLLFKIVSNEVTKTQLIELLQLVQLCNSYAIIIRNESAFCVIHTTDNKFILIDPHVPMSGIISLNDVYKYITYDGVWNFGVNVLIPIVTDAVQQTVVESRDEQVPESIPVEFTQPLEPTFVAHFPEHPPTYQPLSVHLTTQTDSEEFVPVSIGMNITEDEFRSDFANRATDEFDDTDEKTPLLSHANSDEE